MKHKTFPLFALLALSLVAALSGCLRDECDSTRSYIRFDPIYKTLAEMRVGITAEAPRALRHPGKIYAFGHYLFINEKQIPFFSTAAVALPGQPDFPKPALDAIGSSR